MTQPTQAQIIRQLLDHYLNCYDGYKDHLALEAEAALTAAAEVGEPKIDNLTIYTKGPIHVSDHNATIERCAQVADRAAKKALEEYQRCIDAKDAAADYYLWCHDEAVEIAAAIRALKDQA